RVEATAGDSPAGASGSSTTISVSEDIAYLSLSFRACSANRKSRATRGTCSWIPGPAQRCRPGITIVLLRDEPGFFHQTCVQLVVVLEEFDHVLAGQEDRLERLLFHVVLVLGGLRDLLEQINVEGLLPRRD